MKYAQLIKAIDSASRQMLKHAASVVNQALVMRNWLVGAYIVEFEQRGEDRAKYGSRLLVTLDRDLKKRGIRGFSVSTLERVRRLYQVYPQLRAKIPSTLLTKSAINLITNDLEIPSTVSTELADGTFAISPHRGVAAANRPIGPLSAGLVLHFSWSQLQELIRLDNPLKRSFYENECLKGNWSVRQLQRQIGSLLYERTGLSKNREAMIQRAHRQEPQSKIEELIRDPYVLEFAGLAELPRYTESDLEKALLDHLQQFLLELGTGFCFEARQFRVTIGNEHDYVDLVFYHRVLRCHVLLDLKVRAFKHADAGQMNYYLNYFKKCLMREGDNPPVGILLCSDRERTKVEFATSGMDNKVFVSRYLVALPSPEELRQFLEKDRARIETLMLQINSQTIQPRKKGAARDSGSRGR